jgi:hypothetical protein
MIFWMLSTVSKWRPLRWNFSFRRRKKSHGLRSNEYGGLFGQNLFHGDGSVDRDCSRHAASERLHAQFLGQNVVDNLVIQVQLTTKWSDCQTSIRLHKSPHIGLIFFRFWSARSSRTRPVFHNRTAIQNSLCHIKTCALDTACSP